MARLSMNEMTTYRWSFDNDVAEYRAAGIPAIGVWRQKLSDYGEEKGIELLAETGLPVSNLLWAGGFTGSCGHSFRESVDDAIEAIRLASALKAGCLVVYSGGRAGHTHNHARRLLIEAIRELVPLAEDLRVTLAIEPMNPGCAADCTFLTSLADAEAVMDTIGSPRVQLAFDAYQFGAEPTAIELLPRFAGRIAIVHLADGKTPIEQEQNRTRLGDGVVPLAEVVAALSAAGYNGDYDVELIGQEIEATDYRELLEHSKAAYERLFSPVVA
jgi:sugar phosphate isomerase/epimerase